MKDELDLLPTDKRQKFLQIAIIILGVCARHVQISDKVDFLHTDQLWKFPTNWYYDFDEDGQEFPKFPK